MSEELLLTLLLFGSFFVLMAFGLPISLSIALSSIISLLTLLPFEEIAFIAAQKMYKGIDSYTLLAIPFFIFSGNLMNFGGISARLVRFAWLLAHRLPGSLLHTNVVANMLFGAISGSSIAAAAAIGGALGPQQKEFGYPTNLSAAVNIASAPTGILIPPSGPLILYALVSGGTSVAALFLAGYLPGILMGFAVMLTIFFFARRIKSQENHQRISAGLPAWKIILDAIPSLFLIVVIIGGLLKGIYTATEAAAVAVVYSFVLSLCYRSCNFAGYLQAMRQTIVTSASILFLIAASGIMSWALAFTGVPDLIQEAVLLIKSPFLILLVINVAFLVIGFFMDLTPAVLIFTPIFLPIALEIGMHPVHFGITMIFNLGIGNITPPVGAVLFVGCSVAGVSIESVTRYLIPLFISVSVALMLVIYIPQISLWLPSIADKL